MGGLDLIPERDAVSKGRTGRTRTTPFGRDKVGWRLGQRDNTVCSCQQIGKNCELEKYILTTTLNSNITWHHSGRRFETSRQKGPAILVPGPCNCDGIAVSETVLPTTTVTAWPHILSKTILGWRPLLLGPRRFFVLLPRSFVFG